MAQETPNKRYTIPDLPTADEILPYLREIDANKWYSNFGPLVTRFEQDFAAAMAKSHGEDTPSHAVTTCSGYHAISVGLRLLGIGAGKNVLLPAVTFPACPLAVENLGAQTILCDVDPQAWTITPDIARAAAKNNHIDAVMPVCLYGMPLDATGWDAFTVETGIPVLIDAAAAIESQHYLKHGVVAHSLHATKPFGVGEGGILVTASAELAQKARQIINFGTVDRITLASGENAKMSEYHAAVALAQLNRWNGIKRRRQTVFQTYNSGLQNLIEKVAIHSNASKAVVSCMMVALRDGDGAQLLQSMLQEGVACHRTYLPPLYDHPHFKALPLCTAQGQIFHQGDNGKSVLPMTGSQYLNRVLIGLPFHALMKPEEVHKTITIFSQALSEITGEAHENIDNRLVSNG